MKQCSRCRLLLPLSCFYRSRATRDGLYSQCKTCFRQTMQDSRDRAYERHLACKRLKAEVLGRAGAQEVRH